MVSIIVTGTLLPLCALMADWNGIETANITAKETPPLSYLMADKNGGEKGNDIETVTDQLLNRVADENGGKTVNDIETEINPLSCTQMTDENGGGMANYIEKETTPLSFTQMADKNGGCIMSDDDDDKIITPLFSINGAKIWLERPNENFYSPRNLFMHCAALKCGCDKMTQI
jgi:hypothetical protein